MPSLADVVNSRPTWDSASKYRGLGEDEEEENKREGNRKEGEKGKMTKKIYASENNCL